MGRTDPTTEDVPIQKEDIPKRVQGDLAETLRDIETQAGVEIPAKVDIETGTVRKEAETEVQVQKSKQINQRKITMNTKGLRGIMNMQIYVLKTIQKMLILYFLVLVNRLAKPLWTQVQQKLFPENII